MKKFIEVTKMNGGESISINIDSIIYFRPSKHSRGNRTEILVNEVEKPFILEECYEKVKCLIYYAEDPEKYEDVKSKIYHSEDSASEHDEKETEDNDEFSIIIGGTYRSTVGEYIKYNDYFLDYRKIWTDREYRIVYKSLLRTHIFRISDEYYTEKSIGYLHLKTYKNSSDIVMYITDSYDDVYNEIYYSKSDYMGCDIISKYLKDCTESSNNTFNDMYKIDKDYMFKVCLNEDCL